jgi:hypothetical protein
MLFYAFSKFAAKLCISSGQIFCQEPKNGLFAGENGFSIKSTAEKLNNFAANYEKPNFIILMPGALFGQSPVPATACAA